MKIIEELVPKNKFILGLSGGNDSLAAALYFRSKNLDFIAIHVNNGLDGDLEIQEKTTEFCEHFSIPLLVYVELITDKGSIEAGARKARIRAFEKAAKYTKRTDIVLAHHLGDCVSSYLFDMIRGKQNRWPVPPVTVFENYTVWRPFLLTEKKDFTKILEENDAVKFIAEDNLNKNNNLTRNFLTNEVIPLIHSKKHFNLNCIVKKIVESKLKELNNKAD